jgi:hypothetical protein
MVGNTELIQKRRCGKEGLCGQMLIVFSSPISWLDGSDSSSHRQCGHSDRIGGEMV